jgi:hypothetical protein
MSFNRRHILFTFSVFTLTRALAVHAEEPSGFEFHSQRQIGQIDHASVQLDANGDLLVKSGTGASVGKAERQVVGLSCRRDYDEKTLQLPTSSDKTYRAVRYYQEASAKLHKGTVSLSPALRSDRRVIGVGIDGPKVTPFSPRGPLNIDELELLSAVGETLMLDQLLPSKPVKIGDSWPVPDETAAVLLALEEVTANSVRTTLKEVTTDFARFELEGRVEGKLYGAMNQITLKAKCRFDRHTQRVDWFAMGLQQNRDVGMVESGLDWTFQVRVKVTPGQQSAELSEKALADLVMMPTGELLRVRYEMADGEVQLTHDRAWFLTGHYSDQDEFHRLDHGQDIAMCKISPQPQLSVAKLPTARQFQEIVQRLLGANFGEITDASESLTDAHLRIVRVSVKGKDADVPARWIYYHVSDPEGRQVTLAFRVEERNIEAFGHADDSLVQSLRFVEKVEKK